MRIALDESNAAKVMIDYEHTRRGAPDWRIGVPQMPISPLFLNYVLFYIDID
jgi:hypothetical protein